MIKTSSAKLEKAFSDYGVNLKNVKENTVDIVVMYNGKESEFLNTPLLKGYFQQLFDIKQASILTLEKCNYDDDSEERIIYPKLDGNTATRYFRAAFISIEPLKKSAKKAPKVESFDDDEIPEIKPVKNRRIAISEPTPKKSEIDISEITSAILTSPDFANIIAAAVKTALKK